MNRLSANTGFVENGPEARAMARPEQCRQSFRTGGFQRGADCRYARIDLELRILEDSTRRYKKIHSLELRSVE